MILQFRFSSWILSSWHRAPITGIGLE
jgi:hypothetical protein